MAFARMGNAERAWQLWSMLNPINHTLNAGSVGIYKAEPYVMNADVYSVTPHTGSAGWSWYTGSAVLALFFYGLSIWRKPLSDYIITNAG